MKVTIYSMLSGKPFEVELDNYPEGELPMLSEEDMKRLMQKAAKGQITELDLAIAHADRRRAQRKIEFYEEQEKYVRARENRSKAAKLGHANRLAKQAGAQKWDGLKTS